MYQWCTIFFGHAYSCLDWTLSWGLIDWLIDELLVDWLIGWLILIDCWWLMDWLIDWLIDWLMDWCWWIDWLVDWLIGWCCLIDDWLLDWLLLIDWLIDWFLDWLLDWLLDCDWLGWLIVDWLIACLIDWLIDLIVWLIAWLMMSYWSSHVPRGVEEQFFGFRLWGVWALNTWSLQTPSDAPLNSFRCLNDVWWRTRCSAFSSRTSQKPITSETSLLWDLKLWTLRKWSQIKPKVSGWNQQKQLETSIRI